MLRLVAAAAVVALLALPVPALASDGVIEINQTAAQVGGITPNDTPGFPVTIDLPGSYRLTGNLVTGNGGITAIQITASEVTLDLNGFRIIGCVPSFPFLCLPPREMGLGVDAISARNATIKNGSVIGMSGVGVNGGSNARIADVHAVQNGQAGIACSFGCVVTNAMSRENGGIGISCSNCIVSGSTATQNTGDGIFASPGTVTDNLSWSNGGDGIRGGGLIRHNSSANNTGDGIDIASGDAIGNSCINNDGFGLRLLSGGYAQNVLQGNGGPALTNVTGGTSLGHNLCGNGVC